MLGQEKTRELLEQELERLRNENHRLKVWGTERNVY